VAVRVRLVGRVKSLLVEERIMGCVIIQFQFRCLRNQLGFDF
jgi:hypothetical protein